MATERGADDDANATLTGTPLALFNLAHILSGSVLAAGLPQWPAWNPVGRPMPGQMSLPVIICFILASVPALLLGMPRRGAAAAVARIFSALIFLFGMLAILGCVLKLEPLYSW